MTACHGSAISASKSSVKPQGSTPSGPRQNVRWADWSHPMDHYQFAKLHLKGLGVHMNLAQMAGYFTRGACCDIVKIDIEGDEFPAFLDGPDRDVNLRFLERHVNQLLIELHLPLERGEATAAGARNLRRISEAFDTIGMRIFSNETNGWSLGFANVSATEIGYVNMRRLMDLRGGALNISFFENQTAPAATEGSSAATWGQIKGLY